MHHNGDNVLVQHPYTSGGASPEILLIMKRALESLNFDVIFWKDFFKSNYTYNLESLLIFVRKENKIDENICRLYIDMALIYNLQQKQDRL